MYMNWVNDYPHIARNSSLLFYFLGEKARRLIEKYFNIATIVVIILLAVVVYLVKLLGRMFTG